MRYTIISIINEEIIGTGLEDRAGVQSFTRENISPSYWWSMDVVTPDGTFVSTLENMMEEPNETESGGGAV